jgi:putative transposase
VQRFTPLYREVARPFRRPAGRIWSVDETILHVAGRLQYAYRAIDEYGQAVDVYVSPTRDVGAATAFFARAIEETEERPERVTTDTAACYPPAPGTVLPEAEHLTGTMIQQRIERDHQHLKGRTRPMRGFMCRGYSLIRNLRAGFYDVGAQTTTRGEHLSASWAELTVHLAA